MNRWVAGFFACVAIAVNPFVARAAELERIVVADTAEKFSVLVQAIRQEMAPGGRFQYIEGRSRDEVNKGLDDMATMLDKAGSVAAMSKEEQVKLLNRQEKINGLLAKNANDRVVCTYVAPVGSHLPVKECQTVAQREAQRQASRRQMDEWNKQGRSN